jgi:magnesium chelatase subunit D
MSALLPFPALVGLQAAQQALLLLAVEPRLRGVVLAAPAGTGKSSLARGLRSLLSIDKAPFVEVPTSADMESLLCGLDLPATLRTGKLTTRRGALARAHGGIVYVDGVNLLADASINLLIGALDEGEVRVEREGLSLRSPAHFSLIVSYDPSEGGPRVHLLDRVGLLVNLPGKVDIDDRAEVVRRNLDTDLSVWQEELDVLQGLIQAARAALPAVTISSAQIEQLSRTALAFGVQGHRVDLFAVYTACAAAALALRDEVAEEDLDLAVRLVILPRATRVPTPPEEAAPPQPKQPPPPPKQDDNSEEDDPPSQAPPSLPEEQILSALLTELPEEFEDLPFRALRKGRTGSRGATEGTRGRHVRSIPGDPRRHRLDTLATLRAAAPWQQVRARQASAVNQSRTLIFHPDDLRVKQFRSKAGALFCFAVDASGSMALHRMRQAKGAVQTLLQKAYVNRDRVSLIAFRGADAEVLMPPTQSVELAQRALDLLPTGGGTPLASALLLAQTVAAQARARGILQTVLILLTDGRANVSLREKGDVRAELQQIGRHIAESSLQVVVVDTQRSYLSRGEARQLAQWLGAQYAYLPGASGEQIADLATSTARVV